MRKSDVRKVRKYIPSKRVRHFNNFISSLYFVTFIIAIFLIAYIHNIDVQIGSIEKQLADIEKQYSVEQEASEQKVKEANERINAQAEIIRRQIEEEYYRELEMQLAEEERERQLEQDKIVAKSEEEKQKDSAKLIRCTGYCDVGYTASGEWTRDGIAAGKREWLGKTIVLFSVDEDGNIGEKIGEYVFKDTGAGIDTDGDGKGDTIKNGKSIDIWHSTEEACWDWAREYGDYVYMSFVD